MLQVCHHNITSLLRVPPRCPHEITHAHVASLIMSSHARHVGNRKQHCAEQELNHNQHVALPALTLT